MLQTGFLVIEKCYPYFIVKFIESEVLIPTKTKMHLVGVFEFLWGQTESLQDLAN